MKTTHTTNAYWWQAIEKVIDEKYTQIIHHDRFLKVLDLGCGDGTNIFRLSALNSDATYFGFDMDTEAIQRAERYVLDNGLKNIHFLKKDIIHDAFPEHQFDVVICSEVMEHLYDNEKVIIMNKINKSLKQGGFLIVTTPTPECFFRKVYENDSFIIRKIVDFIFQNTYKQRILADFSYGRHHHIGVCDSWYYKKLFVRKGFVLIATEPTSVFQYELPVYIRAIFNFLFIKINPFSIKFSASLVFVCKKESDIIVDY